MRFKKTKFISGFLVTTTAMLLLSGCGNSEGSANYPNNDINVIQGFDPGGGSDQLAQVTQPYLEEYLETTITNEYIPGAAGAVAWTRLANQSNNDGYTISITNGPMLMTNYIMNDEITYTLEDFEPIANIVTDPGVLVVPENSEFDTYEDLAAHLEESPGDLNISNSGVGGDDFFTHIKWENETGLDAEPIPYDGDGPSWQAAAGGDVDASFNNVGVITPQLNDGALKALVVFSEERLESLPDVPTASELGFDVVSGSSRGYSAPAGTPDEVMEVLYDAAEQLADDERFHEGIDNLALQEDIMTGDEYRTFLEEEEKEHEEIWEDVRSEYEE